MICLDIGRRFTPLDSPEFFISQSKYQNLFNLIKTHVKYPTG